MTQNVNLIIEVNEKLCYEEHITDAYLEIGTDSQSKRLNVRYIPGDLILSKEAWDIINADTAKKLSLHFTSHTYLIDRDDTAIFFCDLTRNDLKQPYLILNIYDFRDKKYREWYQYLTKNNFLAVKYPNGGLHILKKGIHYGKGPRRR